MALDDQGRAVTNARTSGVLHHITENEVDAREISVFIRGQGCLDCANWRRDCAQRIVLHWQARGDSNQAIIFQSNLLVLCDTVKNLQIASLRFFIHFTASSTVHILCLFTAVIEVSTVRWHLDMLMAASSPYLLVYIVQQLITQSFPIEHMTPSYHCYRISLSQITFLFMEVKSIV